MSRGIGKKEIVSSVAKKSGVCAKDVSKVYKALVEVIIESVSNVDGESFFGDGAGPKIMISGFGSFQLRPHKGHPVGFTGKQGAFISKYPVLKFDVSPELSKTIRKLPQFREHKPATVQCANCLPSGCSYNCANGNGLA